MTELQTYLDIFLPKKYKETIAREAKIDDARMTFINVLVATIISTIASAIYFFTRPDILATLGATYSQSSIMYKMVMFNPFSSIPSMAITFVWGILMFYVGIYILNAVAKLLGGNGSLGNLLYMNSVLIVLFSLIYGIGNILTTLVSLLSCLVSPLLCIFLIYYIYLQYTALRAVHTKISQGAAIGALILYFILIGAISVLFMFARIIWGV